MKILIIFENCKYSENLSDKCDKYRKKKFMKILQKDKNLNTSNFVNMLKFEKICRKNDFFQNSVK